MKMGNTMLISEFQKLCSKLKDVKYRVDEHITPYITIEGEYDNVICCINPNRIIFTSGDVINNIISFGNVRKIAYKNNDEFNYLEFKIICGDSAHSIVTNMKFDVFKSKLDML